MPYLMRRRNESVVFFEQRIDPRPARALLEDARARTGRKATLLHLVIWALGRVLHERPRLNRFVAGRRLYRRRGVFVSFSAKKAVRDDAPLIVVKEELPEGLSFDDLVERVLGGIAEGRSDRPTTADKELAILLRLPGPLLSLAFSLQRLLDRWGLLPGAFYRSDPFYASAFVANLGSLGMQPGFHHLYEYGDIPIFVTMGAVEDVVVPGPDGAPVIEPRLALRYSFDERIEDGLYCLGALDRLRAILEDPKAAGAG